MKKISLVLLFCLMSIQVSAGDLSSKLSEKGSQFFSNLIGGDGLTEVSIDVRESHEPDYSILLTREILKTEEGNFFTQFSFKKCLFSGSTYTETMRTNSACQLALSGA